MSEERKVRTELTGDAERSTGGTRDALAFDRLFDLLSTERRRYLLYCLSETSRSRVPTSVLVEEVSALEREAAGSPSRRDVELSLRHTHLPKLDAADVIEYDPDESTVEYLGGPELETWVERAADAELRADLS